MPSLIQSKPGRFWMACSPCAFVALLFDQLTKLYGEQTHLIAPPFPTMADHRASQALVWSVGTLPEGIHSTTVKGSFLAVKTTHVANAGVMLGWLEDMPKPVPWLSFMLSTALALIACAWLVRLSRRYVDTTRTWLRIGAVVLSVGVVGNLIDRLRLGYVVDWLYLQWKLREWTVDAPAFNVADLYIIAGACLAGIVLARGWATTALRTRRPSRST